MNKEVDRFLSSLPSSRALPFTRTEYCLTASPAPSLQVKNEEERAKRIRKRTEKARPYKTEVEKKKLDRRQLTRLRVGPQAAGKAQKVVAVDVQEEQEGEGRRRELRGLSTFCRVPVLATCSCQLGGVLAPENDSEEGEEEMRRGTLSSSFERLLAPPCCPTTTKTGETWAIRRQKVSFWLVERNLKSSGQISRSVLISFLAHQHRIRRKESRNSISTVSRERPGSSACQQTCTSLPRPFIILPLLRIRLHLSHRTIAQCFDSSRSSRPPTRPYRRVGLLPLSREGQ